MYPAVEVEARIRRLEATITRLEGELAEALERAEAAERASWESTGPPAAARAAAEGDAASATASDVGADPEPEGDFLDDFLGALHDPVPADPPSPDGHEGNFR